jgi:hypothetical protein
LLISGNHALAIYWSPKKYILACQKIEENSRAGSIIYLDCLSLETTPSLSPTGILHGCLYQTLFQSAKVGGNMKEDGTQAEGPGERRGEVVGTEEREMEWGRGERGERGGGT